MKPAWSDCPWQVEDQVIGTFYIEEVLMDKAPHLLALTIFRKESETSTRHDPLSRLYFLPKPSSQSHPRLTNRLAWRG